MDVESKEVIVPEKDWAEYTPKQGDILVPFHKTACTPIHVGFRQFMGPTEIYHPNCELVYNHGYGRNLVVVQCSHCGEELRQGTNSGECVPLNYQFANEHCKCEDDDTICENSR